MPALIPAIVVLLIAVNALYVAAEFAAVSVRPSRLREIARNGSASAQAMLPYVENPRQLDRYIAGCQIGITLSSLMLGAYGQATIPSRIAPAFEGLGGMGEVAAQSVSALFVLVGLTAVQVVLGELVPKSLALQYPARVALYTIYPMRWSLALFRGFIAVLNGSGLAILRLLGVRETGHRHIHSPDEIELLIMQSAGGGPLEPEERQRLRRALQLGARTASDLMVPRRQVVGVDADASLSEALELVARSPYSRFPVYRDSVDNVIGVVHARDLLAAWAERGDAIQLQEFIRPAPAVPESVTIDRVLAALREYGARQALVIDEFGGLAGLVSLEDILAELFGEFGDEFKRGLPQPERLADGRVRLPGALRVDEAEQWLGVLGSGRAETLGGRIAEALGRLPVAGDRVTIDGVQFEIESVVHHVVGSVVARPRQTVEAHD